MRLYNKPKSLRYVDCAIWIDSNAYSENVDELKMYEYLYYIVNMLSFKCRMFDRAEYYDDFALFATNEIFLRLRDKRQFEADDEGNFSLPRIKSILNYTKKMMYPLKVKFEQSEYSRSYVDNTDTDDSPMIDVGLSYTFEETLDSLSIPEFQCCLHDIAKTAKHFLKKIPTGKNKSYWHNIYVSVMLSLLDGVTPNQKTMEWAKNLVREDPYLVDKIYSKSSATVKLYQCEEADRNYIDTLCRETKRVIARDMSEILHSAVMGADMAKNMLLGDLYSEDYAIED